MKFLSKSELKQYLETTHNYNIVGLIDIDTLVTLPRHTLYEKFLQWHKIEYQTQDRIVLYSQQIVTENILLHIKQCADKIDISSFFILICGPESPGDLFSHITIEFTDLPEISTSNTFLKLPESFCFAPWSHMEISSVGEFKPCCVYGESIKKDNGDTYNINTDSITDVYNSNYLTNLRHNFVAGQRPTECNTCWYKESHGNESNRYWTTTALGNAVELTQVEQPTLSNLISLDIKLGNLCNFRCRICNEQSSSRIAGEKIKSNSIDKIKIQNINSNGNWVNKSNIWKELEIIAPQLTNLDLYGGEPLMIPQQVKFLDFLIDNNYSKNIRIHYNTNGSIFPDKLLHKWSKFKQVAMAFSIDNLGQRFELERDGVPWEVVDSNIDKFLLNRLPNMTNSVYATVSIQNICYLDELIDWYESKKFDALHLNILQEPSFMSIAAMNQDLVNLVLSKLTKIDVHRAQKYGIDKLINFVKTNVTSTDQVELFIAYMLNLDKLRNQKFSLTHPEIAKAINYIN